MAGIKIRMKAQKKEPLSGLEEKLRQMEEAEQVCSEEYSVGGVQFLLLGFEKHYMRTGGYASLTVLLTEYGEEQTAHIVSSGGGEGWGNYSYGANRHFARTSAEVLAQQGFLVEESDLEKDPGGIVGRIMRAFD